MPVDHPGDFEIEIVLSDEAAKAVREWADEILKEANAAEARKQVLRDVVIRFKRHERAKFKEVFWPLWYGSGMYKPHVSGVADIKREWFVQWPDFSEIEKRALAHLAAEGEKDALKDKNQHREITRAQKELLKGDGLSQEQLRQAQQDAMAAKAKAYHEKRRDQIEKAKIAAADQDEHHFWKLYGAPLPRTGE